VPSKPGYALDRDERGLTARQREFLGYFQQGLSWAEIAEKTGVTRSRVGQMRKNLLAKYGPDLLDRYRPPRKLEKLFCWLLTDERGDEQIVVDWADPTTPPTVLIASTLDGIKEMRDRAQAVADTTGHHLRLAKFEVRLDDMAIYPNVKKKRTPTRKGAA
jgi:predicted DNA-binding protein YlxM (UPF0122 family)